MKGMEILWVIAGAAAILLLLMIIEIIRELHRFVVTQYNVRSDKLAGNGEEIRIVFLSDLHNKVYGKKNDILFHAIQQEKPDLILIGGDMLIGRKGTSYRPALSLIRKLPDICPVYYANGNHEQRMKDHPEIYGDAFRKYKNSLRRNGVQFLENESKSIMIKGKTLVICGLAFPEDTFQRRHRSRISRMDLTERFGFDIAGTGRNAPGNPYYILLAHNPAYMDAYLDWGADLILSGHLHGGVVRVPGLGGMITPQASLFPKYSGEMHAEGSQTVVVSRGLGTHTVNLRLFNSAEVVSLSLRAAEASE